MSVLIDTCGGRPYKCEILSELNILATEEGGKGMSRSTQGKWEAIV